MEQVDRAVDTIVTKSQVSEVAPLWLEVAQMAGRFRLMEELSNDVVALSAVGEDILQTQAMIRRDIAGAVLQSALCLREFANELPKTFVASLDAPAVQQSEPYTDEWTVRLVRWADQFGRSLFNHPRLRLLSGRWGDEIPPPTTHEDL